MQGTNSAGAKGLKSRLIAVATQLLVSPREVKLPTMREIATVAGVTPGAAYRHFESQEDLFLVVVTRLFAELEANLDAVTHQTAAILTPTKESAMVADLLHNIALSYVKWGLSNPGGYQLLFERTDDEKFLELGKRPGLELIDKIAKLVAPDGNAKPQHIELVTLLWIGLHGITSLRIHKTGMPWTHSAEEDVDALVGLLVPENLPN